MSREQGTKQIASNRKAYHDYTIDDTWEAGIVLTGTEVKALRAGRASLVDGFAEVEGGEVWMQGVHIAEYSNGTWTNHTPRRRRKLLLHRSEIDRIERKVSEKGFTLVPLSLYFKDGRAKVEIGLAQGKRQYDKRQSLAAKDARRDIEREVGRRAKGRRVKGSGLGTGVMVGVVSFDVSEQAYGRFMGRFSEPLAAAFADAAALNAGDRVLDVGCGPGALTAQLAERLGADNVSAVDPSPSFLEALRHRLPDVDARPGTAERLPFADDTFDAALAQLVVHFMADPVAGLREMGRVTRPGGLVAACVWDLAAGGGPIEVFWQAAKGLDPSARTEMGMAGGHEGHLAQLCAAAGLSDIESSALTVDVAFASVDEWWEPFTLGVGPAGAYVGGLDVGARERLRARCNELLPPAPFVVSATAWAGWARAGGS